MTTYPFARRLMTGFSVVTWLGALTMLGLATVIGLQTGLAIGVLAGAAGAVLTVCALALVQIGRAILDIAESTAVLAGKTAAAGEPEPADEVEDEVPDRPRVVASLEPRLRPTVRVEPPLYRTGSEPGALRAVRA
jgi:hypothetical protein